MKKWVCDKKNDNVPGEGLLVEIFTLKELSKTFHVIESTKDKILEADPNVGVRQLTMA